MVVNNISFVEPNDNYIKYIADNIQNLDKEELLDQSEDGNIFNDLTRMVTICNYNKVVIKNDSILGIIGYKTTKNTFHERVAFAYSITTKNIVNNKFSYLKIAKAFINKMFDCHENIVFNVLKKYKASVKVLNIFGFKPVMESIAGENGNMYVAMIKTKEN